MVDRARDRLVFDATFVRKFFNTRVTYTFGGETSFVSITLDWSESGAFLSKSVKFRNFKLLGIIYRFLILKLTGEAPEDAVCRS